MEVSMGDFIGGPFDAPKPLESIGQMYLNKVYANTEWPENSGRSLKHNIAAYRAQDVAANSVIALLGRGRQEITTGRSAAFIPGFWAGMREESPDNIEYRTT